MKDLDFLLGQSEAAVKTGSAKSIEKLFGGDKFDALQISEGVYNKAFVYASVVCEVSNNDGTEIGGYLITPKGSKDRIARGIYLTPNQFVGSGEIKIAPEDVITSGREIDAMGYKVLGWWHSHGDLETFHSGIDVDNQMTVLNAIASSNYVTERRERENPEITLVGNKIVVTDPKHPGVKYEFAVKDPALLDVVSKKVEEESKIGFAYSMVVHGSQRPRGKFGPGSERGELLMQEGALIFAKKGERERVPYAEIATRRRCSDCQKLNDTSNLVDIMVYKDEEQQDIDESLIRKEIETKVKIRKPVTFFGGWGGKKGKHKGKGQQVYIPGASFTGGLPDVNRRSMYEMDPYGGYFPGEDDLTPGTCSKSGPHGRPVVNPAYTQPRLPPALPPQKHEVSKAPTKKVKDFQSIPDVSQEAPEKQQANMAPIELDAHGMQEFVIGKLIESGVKPTRAIIALTMNDARMQEWYLIEKAQRSQMPDGGED
ncbi:MAG: Mov34/MPN/PAD-1 family protein [archaeon]